MYNTGNIETVETFLYSMPSVWLILFYSFDSNPDAPAPPESSKKSDSDSDDFGDSDNDSMSDWRWQLPNYNYHLNYWLARVILMIPGWSGNCVFPHANNWIINDLPGIYLLCQWVINIQYSSTQVSDTWFYNWNYNIQCFMIYHTLNCCLNGLKEPVSVKVLFHMYWI